MTEQKWISIEMMNKQRKRNGASTPPTEKKSEARIEPIVDIVLQILEGKHSQR